MLDTQAFLWSISAPKRLGARRLTLAEDPQRFVPDQMAQNAFEPLSMQIRHALKVVDLPNIHRDPFDRLLVAQAIIEELALVSGDEQLGRYPVRVVW